MHMHVKGVKGQSRRHVMYKQQPLMARKGKCHCLHILEFEKNVQMSYPSSLAMLTFLIAHLHSSLIILLSFQFSRTNISISLKYHLTPRHALDFLRKAHPLNLLVFLIMLRMARMKKGEMGQRLSSSPRNFS